VRVWFTFNLVQYRNKEGAHVNESSGTAKSGEFLDLLSDYWFLKVDATPGIFENSYCYRRWDAMYVRADRLKTTEGQHVRWVPVRAVAL
jgi:hypothetical protein